MRLTLASSVMHVSRDASVRAGAREEPFGRRLARLRKAAGLSQGELAAQLGAAQSLVSDYEHDRRRVHAKRLSHTHASPVSVEALGATRREPGPRTYPSRPITGVGAVIFMDERVVLIRRRFEPLSGQWSLPGGTVELGETLEAAVAREVREETGLVVAVGPVVEVFDRILFDEQGQVRYHYVLIDYLCSPIAGRLAHGSDVDDVVLADPCDLEPYGLTPKAAGVIAKAARLR